MQHRCDTFSFTFAVLFASDTSFLVDVLGPMVRRCNHRYHGNRWLEEKCGDGLVGDLCTCLFPQVTTDICVKKWTGEVMRVNKNYNEHFKRILSVFFPTITFSFKEVKCMKMGADLIPQQKFPSCFSFSCSFFYFIVCLSCGLLFHLQAQTHFIT